MCTRDKEFTIRGIGDCLARGYDRTGFFEVDTGEQRAWTVQLTETERTGPGSIRCGRAVRCRGRRPAAGARDPRRRPSPPATPRRHAGHAGKLMPMRRQRRTKVVATLGPASSSRAVIARLFEAGADVFRINMSHTSHDKMRELVTTIRAVEAEYNRPIGILVDLQGPKLRLGSFKDGAAEIDSGRRNSSSIPTRRRATQRACNCRIRKFSPRIKPGDSLLIDDGKLRLVATEVAPQRIVAQVEVGGKVSNRKGVQPARHRRPAGRDGAEGSAPISKPRSMPASIGSRCPSSSAPKISPKPRRSPAAAPR